MRRALLIMCTTILCGCQTLPPAGWDGYRKAEGIVLLGSQLDQIDNKTSTSRYEQREAALAIIRTLRILGQTNNW